MSHQTTAVDTAPTLPDAVEESRRSMLLRYAKHGAELTALATTRVVSRTLWWGAWGGVLGAGTFSVMWAVGGLVFPWPEYQAALTVITAVLYVVAGIACWGHAGMWRGGGRFVIALGVDNGWVISLLSTIFDRMAALLRRSSRVDSAMDNAEVWAGELPLQRWKELLASAVTTVLGEDSDSSSRAMRRIRRFVLGQIELVVLSIAREEIEGGSSDGVSMTRVREVALHRAAYEFHKGVVGVMNKQLFAMTVLFLVLSALPPLLAGGLRYAMV